MPSIVSDVSDPRFDGEWVNTWNEDDFGQGISIVTSAWRIETDEGAWTGSGTFTRFHGVEHDDQLVLTGEGAYEGLQAVLIELRSMGFSGRDCPNVRGVVVDAVPDDTAVLD